jgi:hypothetical protein
MAHFIVSAEGSRGAVTRLGGKESGVRATLRTWGEGIQTYLYDVDGVTHVKLVRDGGSNGFKSEEPIYSGPLAELQVQS